MTTIVRMSLFEWVCLNEFVRMSLFEWVCLNEFVRMSLFEWVCSNNFVRIVLFEWFCSNDFLRILLYGWFCSKLLYWFLTYVQWMHVGLSVFSCSLFRWHYNLFNQHLLQRYIYAHIFVLLLIFLMVATSAYAGTFLKLNLLLWY
jgi:hypothetical protein